MSTSLEMWVPPPLSCSSSENYEVRPKIALMVLQKKDVLSTIFPPSPDPSLKSLLYIYLSYLGSEYVLDPQIFNSSSLLVISLSRSEYFFSTLPRSPLSSPPSLSLYVPEEYFSTPQIPSFQLPPSLSLYPRVRNISRPAQILSQGPSFIYSLSGRNFSTLPQIPSLQGPSIIVSLFRGPEFSVPRSSLSAHSFMLFSGSGMFSTSQILSQVPRPFISLARWKFLDPPQSLSQSSPLSLCRVRRVFSPIPVPRLSAPLHFSFVGQNDFSSPPRDPLSGPSFIVSFSGPGMYSHPPPDPSLSPSTHLSLCASPGVFLDPQIPLLILFLVSLYPVRFSRPQILQLSAPLPSLSLFVPGPGCISRPSPDPSQSPPSLSLCCRYRIFLDPPPPEPLSSSHLSFSFRGRVFPLPAPPDPLLESSFIILWPKSELFARSRPQLCSTLYVSLFVRSGYFSTPQSLSLRSLLHLSLYAEVKMFLEPSTEPSLISFISLFVGVRKFSRSPDPQLSTPPFCISLYPGRNVSRPPEFSLSTPSSLSLYIRYSQASLPDLPLYSRSSFIISLCRVQEIFLDPPITLSQLHLFRYLCFRGQ
ncbi:hypothetical protein AVEN_254963-1 [Araneus ventricosus]|uniref:Uncharacterized protein n=1 Tax=Araneus ventricosus TaxID=182803 RepID=A0A4Y2U0L0_ARAVE|nr:hypothetical protein AVEN_254963-1 [Araneus ventricosus]